MTTVASETRRYAATTSKSWDGSASRFTDEQYQRSCLIDRGASYSDSIKQRCSVPVLEPDGTINTNALSTAAGALSGGRTPLKDVSDAMVSRAKSKLRSLYRAAGMEAPDSLAAAEELPRHELLVELGELETVDLPGVEILAAGGPYFGTGSPPEGDTFDDAFLGRLAEANNALARQIRAPIKIGHSKAQRLLRNSGLSGSTAIDDGEQPAAGWLENFRVDSGKLLADAHAVPRKIADLMRSKAFRSRSVELAKVVEQTADGPGRTFDAVVTALALLGAKAPAIRTLDDILAWYGEAGTAEELLAGDEEAEDGPAAVDVEVVSRVAVSEAGADTSGMSDSTTTQYAELPDEKIVELATALGIEETDAAKRRDAVLARFKDYSGETTEPPSPPDPGEPAPPEPSEPSAAAPEAPPAAAAAPDPRVAALEARADRADRVFEERRVEKRDANIGAAIKQGRIDPADKAKWERFFDDNAELALDALLSIPPSPRRVFGSDDPGRIDETRELVGGYDRAYGQLAGSLGITPYSLPVETNGGSS